MFAVVAVDTEEHRVQVLHALKKDHAIGELGMHGIFLVEQGRLDLETIFAQTKRRRRCT